MLSQLGSALSLLFVGFTLFAPSANSAPAQTAEQTLHLRYQMKCDPNDQTSFPGITGEALARGTSIKIRLFKYLNEAEVSLGAPDSLKMSEIKFQFDPSKNCELLSFDPEVREEILDSSLRSLAFEHSPNLVIRPDELSHPDRDVPMGVTYSILQNKDGFSIRYTYFFSNETVHGLFTTSKPTSLGAYGRRSDVEWIYQVNFSKDKKVLSRIYQGGIVLGLGHLTHHFKGNFLTGTDHPILYNIAKHNVFSDHPKIDDLLYRKPVDHLIPREQISEPEAREVWLWNHPWTFDVTDRELRRDGELSHPSNEYLYVRVNGAISKGKFRLSAKSITNTYRTLAGEGQAWIKKLGEDLFQKETFSAIHLPEIVWGNPHGNVYTEKKKAQIDINSYRFYRLSADEQLGMRAEEITPLFHCDANMQCSF